MYVSVNAHALNWVKVFENNFRTSYIDIERYKRNDTVVFWTLTDYGESNNLSSVSKYKDDCLKEKTHLYFSDYHEPMGRERVVSEDSWKKSKFPKQNSEEYGLMQFACKHNN